MGIIAIVSTFLVYQIAKEKFSNNVALLSSTLFAVSHTHGYLTEYCWILSFCHFYFIDFTCDTFYKITRQDGACPSFRNNVKIINIHQNSRIRIYSSNNLDSFPKKKEIFRYSGMGNSSFVNSNAVSC